MAAMSTVPERVARIFAKKCWWADLDDLVQQARLACFEARRNWDSRVGVPFDAYAYSIAYREVGRYLLKQSAPVSAGWHSLGNLRGLHRAPESEVPEEATAPWVDEVMERREWCGRVRARLYSVLALDMPVDEALMACAVLLDGDKPTEVARRYSVSVAQVYRVRKRASSLVLHDLHCYRLWREQRT